MRLLPLLAAVVAAATALPAASQTSGQTAALPPTSGGVADASVVSVLQLIGRPVLGPGGEQVATIHDVVFGLADGRVRAALAPSGGSGLVSAPSEALRLRPDGGLQINADRVAVAALPALSASRIIGGAGAPGSDLLVRDRPLALTPMAGQ